MPITSEEFECFRRLIYDQAGIVLVPEKRVMVASRLAKRLDHYGLNSYGHYFQLATHSDYSQERQMLVNILTTNETYFFREPKHFEFLSDEILKHWRNDQFRVWSAASSTGEEAYSLAMVLSENLGMRTWDVFASDLNTQVLATAKAGVYPMDRLDHLDTRLMEKYCLKGVRSHEGLMRVDEKLRRRVRFEQVNLMTTPPSNIGKFDAIFLRNVLIYFDQTTKKQVVERLLTTLRPGGYFFISHAESLYRVSDRLEMLKPSIYRKL